MQPISEFDFKNYNEVIFYSYFYRIGVDIVEVVIPVILLKDHGDQRHYVQFII
jgi:hypothetical protein